MPLSRVAAPAGRAFITPARYARNPLACRAAAVKPDGGSAAQTTATPSATAPQPPKAGPAFLSDLLSFEVSSG
jgi:hypothetical protein